MFETKNPHEVASELKTDLEKGLSSLEASERLLNNGLNKLTEKKKKPLIFSFLSQFNNPMIFILLGAALLSVGIAIFDTVNGRQGDWADPIIILGVVLLNSIIGTVQESKAEKSLEALKKMSAPITTVKRDGTLIDVKAEELVVGDVVILDEGQIIPADLRLVSSSNLKTDESSLTGESLPVEKDADFVFSDQVVASDRINCAYMSTPVVYGHGEGVVISTGMNTEIGHIASLLSNGEEEQTPLQKKLASLSKLIGLIVIIAVVVIFGVEILQLGLGGKFSSPESTVEGISSTFLTAISIAVAAVPEGLPAVVTIVLALGVQKMAGVNTIVRKLPSVETLGAVSVICSDKTGTLTQNKMTVVEAYILNNHKKKEEVDEHSFSLLANGLTLCSNASIDNGLHGDPTEIALIEFSSFLGHSKSDLEEKYPRFDEIPFDSNRKMMSTLNDFEGHKTVFTKGAIDSVLKFSNYILDGENIREITSEDIKKIEMINNDMSSRALRVLALAIHKDEVVNEENLVFVGLVGMVDPPRPEAKEAVEILKKASISTIMITGDHKVTALAIAKELGIADDDSIALSGSEIDELSEEELGEKVKTVRVFARVSPLNKVQIVNAVRKNGHIAAMTGDGVNDAPSLKNADIGIAMGITGTDVAKGAAEMVLTDDNFASIQKAVEEGRNIFANIRKTVLFLLSSNIAEVLTMFVAVCIGFPTPLLAIHILWVNLVTDSLPAVALGADEKEKDIMFQKPRNPKDSLFSQGGYLITFGYGLVITLATLLGFLIVPFENGLFALPDIIQAFDTNSTLLLESQTAAFAVLSLSELFHMLGMTSTNKSFIHVFRTKNWLLWVSFFLGTILTVGVIMIPKINIFFSCYPFDAIHWLYIVLLSLLPLIVHEIVVLILYVKRKSKNK